MLSTKIIEDRTLDPLLLELCSERLSFELEQAIDEHEQ